MSSENVSTESLSGHTYEEIPEEVHAVDNGLDDEDWLELQKGNVDISLIQELEQAKEEYRQRTHKCDIVDLTTLHTEVVRVSCRLTTKINRVYKTGSTRPRCNSARTNK